MPRFNNDEEVLVFLKKDKKKTDYKVFAGEEGKITVINDSKTGEKITSSNVKIEHLKAQIKSYLKEK
jgi:enhancing lycopene biosynthesis protein 2